MVHMMVKNDDAMMDFFDGIFVSAYDGAYDGEK